LQTYTRLISALYGWQADYRRAQAGREHGDRLDVAGWGQRVRTVSELVALADLTAPAQVRDLARRCYDAYVDTGSMLALGEDDPAAILAKAG
jgi:hypothetical protein